jgi:hypothetical protein
MPTKRQVVVEAYEELGKASYEFDLNPDMLQSGLRRLDGMMAEWGGTMGVRVGYSGGAGEGSIDADTQVPDWAFRALYLNLALSLAPTFGKTVAPETMRAAKAAIDAVMARTVPVAPRNLGGGYAGAGAWGGWPQRNLPQPVQPLVAGRDGFTILEDGA